MTLIDVKPRINQEIIAQLKAEKAGFWVAAHNDGSGNRVNWEAVADAYTVGILIGTATTIFQGLKKAFKNRNKTKRDLEAEKEAEQVNQTCVALEQMLLEYFEAAQKGLIEEESLDELIGTLQDIDGYYLSGKLVVPGEQALSEIAKSIEEYTAAIEQSNGVRSARETGVALSDRFNQIWELLLLQRELLFEGSGI